MTERSKLVRLALVAATVLIAAAATPGASARGAATGAQASMLGITPSTRLGYLEYARMGLGEVRNLRVPIFWEDLQPVQGGGITWQKYDEIVVYAAVFGIRLQPFVMGVPLWMGRREDPSYPPIDSQEFRNKWQRLLTSLAERYGPGGELWRWLRANHPEIDPRPIRTWQIWNEVNAYTYWHPAATVARDYADLLRLSARALHRQDPAASVVVAGLFEDPSDGFPMQRFLSQLYAQPDITRSFDAIAVHPYSTHVRGVVRQIRTARGVMNRNDDADTELWVTELGWPTEGDGVFLKSEPEQARILSRTFRRVLSRRKQWRIGRLTWYTWRDSDQFGACFHCNYSGLFRRDLTAKPAWNAFVRLTGGTAKVPALAAIPPRPALPPSRGPLR